METQVEFGKLSVKRRELRGKGNARKLRASGLAPAVMYGEKGESIALTFSPFELKKSLDPSREVNTLLTLVVEGEGEQNVVIKDFHLDSLTGDILHVDFLRVAEDTVLSFKVPLRLTGRPAGVQLGGKLSQVYREVPVRCVPQKVPSEIVADVSHLGILQALDVADLQPGDGVEVAMPGNRTIALVLQPRGQGPGESAEESAAS